MKKSFIVQKVETPRTAGRWRVKRSSADFRRLAATCLVAAFGSLLGVRCPAGTEAWQADAPAPAWRGQAPGTDYLGPDVLWRPREWLIFHMQDEAGTGFDLDFTVRDMNTYMQGPRPVMFWVIGPQDETLHLSFMEDDGVVSGNEQYRDGVYDVYQDARYREWHRVNSSGGYPPGKQRSPHLAHPERLPFRRTTASVPAAGPGLYRVVVVGSWDHWISVTPNRPIPTGIHPGPGPLQVETDRLDEAYLYIPPQVEDIGVTVIEEIQPYNWRAHLETLDGKTLATTEPRTFANFFAFTPGEEQRNQVVRLRLSGETTGAHLHVVGVPFVLCPDPETAALIQGGLQIDSRGRQTFFHLQRVLHDWADGLDAASLAVTVAPPDPDVVGDDDKDKSELLRQMPELLAKQDVDPASPTFGAHGDPVRFAEAAGWEHPANPYHAHPGVIRRALLGLLPLFNRQAPFFWYQSGNDLPRSVEPVADSFVSIPFRSCWYGLGRDSLRVSGPANAMKGVMHHGLPEDVIAAWRQSLDLREGGRLNMHTGEIANQWLYNLEAARQTWRFTGNPQVPDMIHRHLRTLLTPGLMGRLNPDPTPYQSKLGYGRPADSGRVGAGYLSECYGFDTIYSGWCQEGHLREFAKEFDIPLIADYLAEYSRLKNHLVLPKNGGPTASRWTEIAAPADFSSRTQGQPLMGENLGDRWPSLSEEPFVRVLDNAFFFVNTPDYYAISYGGPTVPDWMLFSHAEVGDGSAALVGYRDFGRGGQGRKANKPGGLGTVFVRGCGPTLLGFNHDVMFANTVWGRLPEPVFLAGGAVDPTVVCEGYVDPVVTFDRDSRIMRRSGTMTHAPLHFTRAIHFRDDRIEVEVRLLALQDIEFAELFEALPFMVDKRSIRLFDGQLAEVASFAAETNPEGATTNSAGMVEVGAFQALELTAANGAGAAIVLDRAYPAQLGKAFKLRAETVAVRSFSLALPTTFKAGEQKCLRYVVYPQQQAMTEDVLTKRVNDLNRQ